MKHAGEIDYTLSNGLDSLDHSLTKLRELESLQELADVVERLHDTLEQFANDDIMEMIGEVSTYCADISLEIETIGEVMDFDY